MTYTFEVALDSIESAITAQACGADRIELVADLGIGGITPSHGMMKVAKEQLTIPINVMIRPRRGDFFYTDAEFEMMKHDIEYAKSLNLNGVVLGILRPDGYIDTERTRQLVELARPLDVTFHRAFDMCIDPHRALDELMGLGVDTLLTSGQQASVDYGLPLITALVKQANGRIKIMPGAGINASNIKDIVAKSGAKAFHFSGMKSQPSPMRHHNPDLFMGSADDRSEYQRHYADPSTLKAIMANANAQ